MIPSVARRCTFSTKAKPNMASCAPRWRKARTNSILSLKTVSRHSDSMDQKKLSPVHLISSRHLDVMFPSSFLVVHEQKGSCTMLGNSAFGWLKAISRDSRKSLTEKRGGNNRRAVSFIPRLESLEDRSLPSTLTVLNNADSGPGSLRDTIAVAS